MPLGQSFITAGIVDLNTGDVQWMSFDSSPAWIARNPADVDSLMRDLYQTWPGPR